MSRRLIETHTARNPRLLLFHGITAALLILLVGGLAYRQLFRTGLYSERERKQNQRRVILPAPRGNIYDRDGKIIVGNRPRFAVVLNLAELRSEFRAAYREIANNYQKMERAERPNQEQISSIARTTVAQRYLDEVNDILKRRETVKSTALTRHISQSLLLPFVLLDDLAPEEYARLIERLPVSSPLQVYTSSSRSYPYGNTAVHTLGYMRVNNDPEIDDFGDDLKSYKMKGSVGYAGLEKVFDDQLQGETGGAIYLVDPAGYKIDKPLEERRPVQGNNIVTSLDIDLQQAAEKAMAGRIGSAVAIDIKTGEVLVLASKPDYDIYTLKPNLTPDVELNSSGVWLNRSIQGQYPPGSTFKIITAIAGLRSGAFDPATARVNCPGYYMVGNRRFPCHSRNGHGEVNLATAITVSCNVFFYKYGLETGPNLVAAEADRFGYNEKTNIELPYEFSKPHVASPEWKKVHMEGPWVPGDTANTVIGQGDTLVTPLHVAAMFASFARGETRTQATILHVPNRAPQHTAPVGLSVSDYNAIMNGLAQCYQFGTGKFAKVEGLTGGAKSGTAQKGRIDLAWLAAFAPLENPQIAIAVVLEGALDDDNFGGGTYAAPVVKSILEAWKAKHDAVASQVPFTVK